MQVSSLTPDEINRLIEGGFSLSDQQQLEAIKVLLSNYYTKHIADNEEITVIINDYCNRAKAAVEEIFSELQTELNTIIAELNK